MKEASSFLFSCVDFITQISLHFPPFCFCFFSGAGRIALICPHMNALIVYIFLIMGRYERVSFHLVLVGKFIVDSAI
jgi:hypothetical protein